MAQGRRLVSLLVVMGASALVLSPGANAATFTGSLAVTAVGAPTAPYGSVVATADATVSQTCDPVIGSPSYEYCGYFPVITTTQAGQLCAPAITGSSWVGSAYAPADGPGDKALTPSWQEWPSIQSGPKRACLYVSTTSGYVLVAQALYDVPAYTTPAATTHAATTPTATTGTTAQGAARVLTMSFARSELVQILGTEYEGFSRSSLRRDCYRLFLSTVRCRVTWDYRHRWRYRGFVDIRLDPDDPEAVTWEPSIRRTRIHRAVRSPQRVAAPVQPSRPTAPSTPTTPAPAPTAPSQPAPTGPVIPNPGRGYPVRCNDGSISNSGGIQGACSHHGGVAG
jgi:hypothetical protein